MNEEDKTKEQLITELVELRKRIADIEKSETQRNQTEEALREAEARYRAFLKMQLKVSFRPRPMAISWRLTLR